MHRCDISRPLPLHSFVGDGDCAVDRRLACARRLSVVILALALAVLSGAQPRARAGTTTAATTATASVGVVIPAGYPTSANTGVPAGVRLTPYTGPCVLRSAVTVTITAKDVSARCGALIAYRGKFVISRSKLPRVEAQLPGVVSAYDSDIWGGDQSVNSAAITYNVSSPTTGFNLILVRDDIQGGKNSVECRGNCYVASSYLHNQRSYGGAHIQGFLSSGGNAMSLRGNSISCSPPNAAQGAGCTADVALFGDMAKVNGVTIQGNLLLSGSYAAFCLYGGYQPTKRFPISTNIWITNNVFQRGPNGRCVLYGAVTSTRVGSHGNTWSNNMWFGGTRLNPAI